MKGSSGSIELHLDKKDGTKIGTLNVKTGSSFEELETAVDNVTGVHDLFLVFAGSGSNMFEFDYWYFESAKAAVPQGPFCGRQVGLQGVDGSGKIEAEDYDVGGRTRRIMMRPWRMKAALTAKTAWISSPGFLFKGQIRRGYTVGGASGLEYTVNVAKAGVYQFRADVSSGNDAAGFMLYLMIPRLPIPSSVGSTGDWNTL